MKPVRFPQASNDLLPAEGDEGIVGVLPACRVEDGSGIYSMVSCFELQPGELETIQKTGRVWLWVGGSGPHPPVGMSADSPFDDTISPPEGVSIEEYSHGYMISDYRSEGEPRHCGVSMDWRPRPIIFDPFPTEREAIEAALQT